jgi:hypothetical protein
MRGSLRERRWTAREASREEGTPQQREGMKGTIGLGFERWGGCARRWLAAVALGVWTLAEAVQGVGQAAWCWMLERLGEDVAG